MTKTFKIAGMGCTHCVKTIENGFSSMEHIIEVNVSLEDASMVLTYDETKINDNAICSKIAELGYECVL